MKQSNPHWIRRLRAWLLNYLIPLVASILGILKFFDISRHDLARYLAVGGSIVTSGWEVLADVWERFGGMLAANGFYRTALSLLWLYLMFIGFKNIRAWGRITVMKHLAVRLVFDTADGSIVRLIRASKELPARANVVRFIRSVRTITPQGRIPSTGLRTKVSATGYEGQVTTHLTGDDAFGWDVVGELSYPLPYRWFYPFIPDWLRRDEITKVEEVTFRDEFCDNNGSFQLSVDDNLKIPFSVTIAFHPDRIPSAVHAYVIRHNYLVPLSVQLENDRDYQIRVAKLRRGSKVRIAWEFPM